MTGSKLRAKRIGAGISGALVCVKAGIGRSRLSEIERGYIDATADEIALIENALGELVQARQKLNEVAMANGWPAGVMR